MFSNEPTPKWAVHHPNGGWSCADCGRAGSTLAAVRGHRRACPGIGGLVDRVAQIGVSVLPSSRSVESNLSRLSGSQPAARASGSAARSQPHWAPVPFFRGSSQPVQPAYGEPSSWSEERAGLQQRVVALEGAVKSLTEIATNDLTHLAEARVIDSAKPNPWPWVLGTFGLGIVLYWAFSPSSEDQGVGISMGSSRPAGVLGRVADRVVSKVADRLVGKALSSVF